jgi:hypothetical protein
MSTEANSIETAALDLVAASPASRGVRRLYLIEALAATGGTLFTIGFYFYTRTRFGWDLSDNFKLAATQGVTYVAGAMLANVVTRRLPHLRTSMFLHLLMAIACAAAAASAIAGANLAVIGFLLLYTFASAMAWPILESVVAQAGPGGDALAKRLGVYNVVWPLVGAGTLAVSGTLIESIPAGVFIFPSAAHLVCMAIAWLLAGRKSAADDEGDSHHADPPHPTPEPELLRLRMVALWISRLGLPATYALIYGLMPMMPTLPAMARLDLRTQTVVSSTWLAARWLTFLALSLHNWWHTRPRAMVAAAGVMFLAFLGVTLAPSQLFGSTVAPEIDLLALVFWQILLGVALGTIYSGSLYFGMVLSQGSTEHSGYHEALIGLGWILGPMAGVAMQTWHPADPHAGVTGVGIVIGLSVLCVAIASLAAGRRRS